MDDSKDTKKNLTTKDFAQSYATISIGKNVDKAAKKMSELLNQAKEEALQGEEIVRISTLDDGVDEDLRLAFEADEEPNALETVSSYKTAVSDSSSQDTGGQNSRANNLRPSPFAEAITQDNPIQDQDYEVGSIRTLVSNQQQSAVPMIYDNHTVLATNQEGFTSHEETTTSSDNEHTVLQRIKTLINDKTFQFTEDQGAFSKGVTVASKSTETAGKAGVSVTRASKRVQTANDDTTGTGQKSVEHDVNRKMKEKAGKYGKSAKSFVQNKFNNIGIVKSIKTIIRKAMTAIFKKLLIAIVGSITMLLPLFAVAVAIIAVLTMFGGGGDDRVVNKYETYMTATQAQYDTAVDQWQQRNPDGIVIGIRGTHGNIDWRSPLAIIQGISFDLDMDIAETAMLNTWQTAGLFEKHIESSQTIQVTEEGEVVDKEIKVLTIVNASYDDYVAWCNENLTYLNTYRLLKQLPAQETPGLTSDELSNIAMLRTSSNFYDNFSIAFHDHQISTGENISETDLDDIYYTSMNPFFKAGYRGQCTWYVYGRSLKVSDVIMPTGDAQLWLTNANIMGLATGHDPSKDAIVVLSGGNFGHVAYVEAWDGTSITISEANYNNPCSDGTCDAVAYANEHYKELMHEQSFTSLEEYKAYCNASGFTLVGFIYPE